MVKVVHKHLHKGKPETSLLEPQKQNAGRNNNGHITMRHKGGGHKHHYRVDRLPPQQGQHSGQGRAHRVRPQPHRAIALLCYADGERRYIIAPRGLEVGSTVLSGAEAPIKAGNTLPIRNIPIGATIHCVEMLPGKGRRSRLGRHFGTLDGARRAPTRSCAFVQAKCGASTSIAARRSARCRTRNKPAPVRQGRRDRWQGIRPTVRGVAMNPVDHPYGGGEGRTGEARAPVSPWNTLTKGDRTRRNKRTQTFIVSRRKK